MENSISVLAEIDYPSIIAVAAKSPFGILALLIIAVSIVACVLFWNAGDKSRVFAFFLLFFGMSAFGSAVFYERLEKEEYLRAKSEEKIMVEQTRITNEKKQAHILELEKQKTLANQNKREHIESLEKLKQKQLIEKLRIKKEEQNKAQEHKEKMEIINNEKIRCKPYQRKMKKTKSEWLSDEGEENGRTASSACKSAKNDAKLELNSNCDAMGFDQIGSGRISKIKTIGQCDCEDLTTSQWSPEIWCKVERKALCTYDVNENELYHPCK